MSGSNAPDALALAPGRAGRLPGVAVALAERLAFRDPLERVRAAQQALPQVAAELSRLRAQGYGWRGDLEARLAAARQHGPGALAAAQAAADTAAQALEGRVGAFHRRVAEVCARNPLAHAEDLAALVEEQQGIEVALRDADRRVEAAGLPLIEPVEAVSATVQELLWGLAELAEARFQLGEGEQIVAVLPATWADPPDRLDKQGLLYLSDGRLRFEQKEVFVTGRGRSGLATGHNEVQKLWIDEPYLALAAVTDGSSGVVPRIQAVVVEFGAGASLSGVATLTLTGTAKADEIVALLHDLRAGRTGRLV